MNSLALFKKIRMQRPTLNAQGYSIGVLGALLFSLTCQELHAQVGTNNPTGVAGIFNGNITTGCSYDPYTGNAIRAITDIRVAGAVGDYPLALVRTSNSRRHPNGANPFEDAGGWNHNYDWIMDNSPTSRTPNFQPTSYTLYFPDGRVQFFQSVSWDSGYYRVRKLGGADSTSAGVRERVLPLNLNPNSPDYMFTYLILPDGGKVKFQAFPQQLSLSGLYYYSYQAVAIIDPHGLQTNFTYNGNGWLYRVTEPAGRYLQFTYDSTHPWRITQVTASDGRSVTYYYAAYDQYWNILDHVIYYGNAQDWTAHYRYCPANIYDPNYGTMPLLSTADDPMYPGPMKKIGYIYQTGSNPDGSTVAYGQIHSENYYDGTNVGLAVSTLSVTSSTVRTETRADGKTRTFNYDGGGYLTSCTDFMGHSASQGYDAYRYINYVIDRNSHRTDYTNDPITGLVKQITYPLTPNDTVPQQTDRPTVNFTYSNNYYLASSQDEAHHTPTTFARDTVYNRVTSIAYSDGGYEIFSYDPANFYQLSSHRLKTGGTETFAYDSSHRLQYYSDPYHSNPGNFSVQYFYDGLDRVNGLFDTLYHPTNFDYNDRGQITVTTLPPDPSDNQRHTITNAYNPDGTLQSVTDQLLHVTSYTYDDYCRLRSVMLPDRGDNTGTHTTNYFYGPSPTPGLDDYKYTDSNVTWIVLPSNKQTHTMYDDNRRKTSVTVGTNDAATTTYGYDLVGNRTSVKAPNEQPGQLYYGKSTAIAYDERNRPSSITDALSDITSFTYDLAGHKYQIIRPNNQTVTYNSYDAMNRLLQQTVTETPNADAITEYTYYTPADGTNAPVGLLKTMQDPRLVANSSSEKYIYSYDSMGRKTQVQYPLDSYGVRSTEQWSYDTVGRLQTFTNRDNPAKVQTFSYDALNRMTGYSWNDNGVTPSVSFGYDPASRLTSVNNASANISKAYFNDNLLSSETENITGGVSKTVTYAYDADGNRASLGYPDNGYSFTYGYTGRNQLNYVFSGNTALATYGYNVNGDMISRTLQPRGSSSYTYDALDRVIHIQHSFTGASRTFDYDYDTVGNRKWMKREDSSGDVFGYDSNDQLIAGWLDIMHPDITPPGDQSIFYDGAGNRTTFEPYDWIVLYTVNDLNQYTQRNSSQRMDPRPTPTPRPRPSPTPRPTPPGQQAAAYDHRGAISSGFDGSTYLHDAQNRLLSATNNSTTMSITYDGLNRQVSRAVNGVTTYNVWDGWDLVQEYHMSGNTAVEDASYLYGAGGLVKNLKTNNYYYQDASGSTSHLADANGNLIEWYRYDLQGTPIFYDPNNNQIPASNYGVRHLFTGQQWYSELGLYDLRNRFYSPDIGRFLQPDPIGFWGDRSNLYRYVKNNPVRWSDPWGLCGPFNPCPVDSSNGTGAALVERVTVTGTPIFDIPFGRDRVIGTGLESLGGGGGGGGGEPGGGDAREQMGLDRGNGEKSSATSQSSPPPQNPTPAPSPSGAPTPTPVPPPDLTKYLIPPEWFFNPPRQILQQFDSGAACYICGINLPELPEHGPEEKPFEVEPPP